nr:4953_t:CDS:2 [Entrophospora candida]
MDVDNDDNESQQSFYTSQTVCPECNNSLPLIQIDGWCKDCEKFNFQKAFSKWTSGNENIDNFIKETQLKSTRPIDYLEWIPYERFKDIKFIDKSNNDINNGYGNVATAIWLDGPRWSWNEEILKWQRTGETIVALKIMEKTKNINSDYFNEAEKRRMIMLRQREQALVSKMNAKYAKLELHSGNVNVNGGESKMALLQLSELQKVHQQAYYSSRPIPIVITSPRVSLEIYDFHYYYDGGKPKSTTVTKTTGVGVGSDETSNFRKLEKVVVK